MRDEIKSRLIGASALGNSPRGLKELCSDLINGMDKGDIKKLEMETFLSKPTLLRMMRLDPAKSGADYRPMLDTCERILRVAGVELNLNVVSVKRKFLPKKKGD